MTRRLLPFLACLAVLPLAPAGADIRVGAPADARAVHQLLCEDLGAQASELMRLRQTGLPREELAGQIGGAARPLLEAVYLEPLHQDAARAERRAAEFGRLIGDLCRAGG